MPLIQGNHSQNDSELHPRDYAFFLAGSKHQAGRVTWASLEYLVANDLKDSS